ncbi:hypothetical protein MAR_035490, partial [Mya arenaria]
PPVVKPLTNVTVIEEGTVSVVCEITAGVPNKNDFQWERMSDSSKVSMEQTLIFANIDRKQTGYYRCTASNYMEPTRHDASVGISSNTVYIDQSQYLKTASDAKQLDFTISKSVCEDEGIYQCTAQNEHNTKANIRCSSCISIVPERPERHNCTWRACSVYS